MLVGTKIHRTIAWITFLEVFVAAHGATVAILSGQEAWPMFLFGFLMLFVLTRNFGFKWPPALRVITALAYVAGVIIAYSYRGFDKLYELSFIPGTLYAVALVIILLVRLGVYRKPRPT